MRAPGRVNLIGEYTDFNLGYVLPAAIDREIRIAFVPSDDRRVVLHRLDTGERGEFDLDDLPDRSGSWLDYAVGTAWALAAAGQPLRGMRGVIGSNLPTGAGLSSSAAIELAIAQALLADAGQPPDPMALARLAQRAENEFVGVQSGLMDQFAVACGRADAALLLDCRSLDWQPVRLPLDEVTLVVCDTRRGPPPDRLRVQRPAGAVRHGGGDAGRSRPGGPLAARRLARAALAEAEPAGWLEPVVLERATHVVAENQPGDRDDGGASRPATWPLSARLFAASHASLRDLFEVSSAALDALVEIAVADARRGRRPDDRGRLRRLHGQPRPARCGRPRCGPPSNRALSPPGPASSRGSSPSVPARGAGPMAAEPAAVIVVLAAGPDRAARSTRRPAAGWLARRRWPRAADRPAPARVGRAGDQLGQLPDGALGRADPDGRLDWERRSVRASQRNLAGHAIHGAVFDRALAGRAGRTRPVGRAEPGDRPGTLAVRGPGPAARSRSTRARSGSRRRSARRGDAGRARLASLVRRGPDEDVAVTVLADERLRARRRR